jgi:hypothetical protein
MLSVTSARQGTEAVVVQGTAKDNQSIAKCMQLLNKTWPACEVDLIESRTDQSTQLSKFQLRLAPKPDLALPAAATPQVQQNKGGIVDDFLSTFFNDSNQISDSQKVPAPQEGNQISKQNSKEAACEISSPPPPEWREEASMMTCELSEQGGSVTINLGRKHPRELGIVRDFDQRLFLLVTGDDSTDPFLMSAPEFQQASHITLQRDLLAATSARNEAGDRVFSHPGSYRILLSDSLESEQGGYFCTVCLPGSFVRGREVSKSLELRLGQSKDKGGVERKVLSDGSTLFVSPEISLSAKHIDRIETRLNRSYGGEILIHFSAEGALLLRELTREHVGRSLSVLVDNEIIVSPVIREEISGGSVKLSGSYTPDEISELERRLLGRAEPRQRVSNPPQPFSNRNGSSAASNPHDSSPYLNPDEVPEVLVEAATIIRSQAALEISLLREQDSQARSVADVDEVPVILQVLGPLQQLQDALKEVRNLAPASALHISPVVSTLNSSAVEQHEFSLTLFVTRSQLRATPHPTVSEIQ